MNAASFRHPPAAYEAVHLALFAAAALAASALARSHPQLGSTGVLVSVAAIAVAAWHGAFDNVLAADLFRNRRGLLWRPFFYASYLALAAVVLLLWWRVPKLALPLFLLYSALHFGLEGEPTFTPRRVLTGFAMGALPIAAACHWWPAETCAVFECMLHHDARYAGLLASVASGALWPLVVIVLFFAGERRATWALVPVELLLFRCCPPIAAFALFFCCWHAPEHMLETSFGGQHFEAARFKRNMRAGLLPWLVSICGLILILRQEEHALPGVRASLFVWLSALTVPHMTLAEMLRQRHNDSRKPVRAISAEVAFP